MKTMQRVVSCRIAAVGVLCLGSAFAVGQIVDDTRGAPDQPIHLRVHADQIQGQAIPRTVFGSFLEPIGHSTYGGLLSELLENASFEEGLWSAGAVAKMVKERPELERASKLDLPLPWEPLDARQGNRYEPQFGDAANSSNSLLIMGLPSGEVGIRQRIYLPVHRVLTYRGSIFVKHQSGPAKVYISLRKRDNAQVVFADTTIDAAGNEWTKYPFELTLKPGMVGRLQPVDFVIALLDDSRAYIDQVSLMPADNVDGMDRDVVQMARELQTPLVRFGGNYTSSYHWKNGVGPPRPARKSIQLRMEHSRVQHFRD